MSGIDEINRCLLGKIACGMNQQREVIESLRDVEFRAYSQFGEDGIIDWLIHWVKPEQNSFVEFGVENYTEANTRFLLMNRNWRGLIMDGSKQHMDQIRTEHLYWRQDLTSKEAFITKENINGLLEEEGMSGDLGLLSIDIDGNDYWVLKEITNTRAAILCMEYNPIFGDVHEITVPYHPAFSRFDLHHSGLCFGSSIQALIREAKAKGYEFVGTCSNGINAFFVREDLFDRVDSRITDKRMWPGLHRDSRDEKGQLTFVGGKDRLDLLAKCKVWDCVGETERELGSFPDPFSESWLAQMGGKV